MVPYVDIGMLIFMKKVVLKDYPNYTVAWGKPERSRQILANAKNQARIGIPGLTVFRTDDEENTEFLTRPVAHTGLNQGYVPGTMAPAKLSFLKEIPVRLEYTVSAWAKELDDLNNMNREFYYAGIYKNVEFAQNKTKAFTETGSISVTESVPSATHAVKNPIIGPGSVAITFGSDDFVGATDDSNGFLVFVSPYANDYHGYTGTVDYKTGIITINTNTQTSETVSFSIAYHNMEILWAVKAPIFPQKGTTDTIDSEKTGKPLWYHINKVFYVDTKWCKSVQLPQVREIDIIYKEMTAGNPVTLETLDSFTLVPT